MRIPIFLFLTAFAVAAAEDDFLGRCGKESVLPAGLNPIPGRKYARDRTADIRHLALEVTPDFTRGSVEGMVTITFSPLARPLVKLELDAVDLSIDSVG